MSLICCYIYLVSVFFWCYHIFNSKLNLKNAPVNCTAELGGAWHLLDTSSVSTNIWHHYFDITYFVITPWANSQTWGTWFSCMTCLYLSWEQELPSKSGSNDGSVQKVHLKPTHFFRLRCNAGIYILKSTLYHFFWTLYISSITAPQDVHKRIVLQVYHGLNTLEFSAIHRWKLTATYLLLSLK